MQIIGYHEAEPLLDWKKVAAALHAGHKLPRAQIRDLILQRGTDTVLNRLAWIDGLGCAVKTATIFPENQRSGKKSVNGAMTLFSDATGEPEAVVDFHLVTKWKTAGDSILAAQHLARPDSRDILLVGAGAVARSLVEAYAAIFSDAKFSVWNRTAAKAVSMAQELSPDFEISAVADLPSAVSACDIVACATMSATPVIQGDWLSPGTHLDLIGAYRPDMRETDDASLARSRIFVDSRETTMEHIGEIKAPLEEGAIKASDIVADFYDLDSGSFRRRRESEITLFKNGGGAHLDLMTANYIVSEWRNRQLPGHSVHRKK